MSATKTKMDCIFNTSNLLKCIIDFMHSGSTVDGETITYSKEQLTTIRDSLTQNHEIAFCNAALQYLESAGSSKLVPLEVAAKKPGTVKGTYATDTWWVSNQYRIKGTSGKMYTSINKAYCNNGFAKVNGFGHILAKEKNWNPAWDEHFQPKSLVDPAGIYRGMWVPLSEFTVPLWNGMTREEDGMTWGRIYFPYGTLSLRTWGGSYMLFPMASLSGVKVTDVTCDSLGYCDRLPATNVQGEAYPEKTDKVTVYLNVQAYGLWKGDYTEETIAGVPTRIVELRKRKVPKGSTANLALPGIVVTPKEEQKLVTSTK